MMLYTKALALICYCICLFALWILRQHGLPADELQVIFQAIVINELTYASPAWCGFASTDDQNRIEAFLPRSTKLGYQANSKSTFASLCEEPDERLFHHVTYNRYHLLHSLLLPWRNRHYSRRQRTHDYELPDCMSELKNKKTSWWECYLNNMVVALVCISVNPNLSSRRVTYYVITPFVVKYFWLC